MDFEFSVKEAEDRVSSMDGVDGFKDRELRTILLALEAGLKDPRTGAQFDAYVMLKEVCDSSQ